MIPYIPKRAVSILLSLITVSIMVFPMMHTVVGGPFDGNDTP